MPDDQIAQPPSPDMIRFRDAIADAYAAHRELDGLPIAERRAVAEAVRAPWCQGGPRMHASRDLSVTVDRIALRLRLHLPAAEAQGVLAYVHGGGWTLFSLDTHDRLMREYAARAGLAVIGIDYSLVPEAIFPTAVREVAALLRWLRGPDAADVLGWDPSGHRIVVGGDSAGGNLAMGAALLLRDENGPLPDAILMNYGVVDPDPTWPSYALYDGAGFNLTRAEMAAFWRGYDPDGAARRSPYAALLCGSLRRLPPCLLAVAECDVLRDENLALAKALEGDGVVVDCRVYAGMLHSFLEAVSISPTADRALADSAGWLRAVVRPFSPEQSQL